MNYMYLDYGDNTYSDYCNYPTQYSQENPPFPAYKGAAWTAGEPPENYTMHNEP